MKRLSLAMMAVLMSGLCVEASAAQPQSNPAAGQAQIADTERAQLGRADDATTSSTIRASQLIGMDIHNLENEEIGSVDDIVLDAETGKIRYAAVSYGGFLGLGDKLFAVPWAAFKYQKGDDDYQLVLNASEEQLKTAQGFDQDQWPDFANRKFTAELDKHYGVEYQADRRSGGINVDVGRDGVEVDVERSRRDRDRPRRNR